ncbi:MFS transporter [Mesorhizobium sp.]|uniref:MFS transporter n=1 Tax=Mesorhizobium sp. TaxID=1871066 RepID=UPI0025D2FD63|nr:MFS transporter [Mesorhizobium sp.]
MVQAASTLPAFILSVFVGAIADNLGRRGVMLVGRSLIVAASAVLSALVALGFADPWIILGVSFMIGCGVALNDPAWQASIGDTVERRDIPAAVTLLNFGFNTIRSVGPALGGIVVASFGPLITLLLSTLSYVVPLGVIGPFNLRRFPASAIYDNFVGDQGGDHTRSPSGLAGIAILALLLLVVRDHLDGGPFEYGVLMAGFGIGAFFAGITAGHFRRRM